MEPDSGVMLDPNEARRCLDAFLVDNEDLESLTATLNRFNIFRVLKIEHSEIRHSNVLAWLLTPTGTHGLGATFLRRFVSKLLLENDTRNLPLTPAAVELMKLDDVEVLREWASVDVLAVSRSNRWCLAIENKVGARESIGQLGRYRRAIDREFPGCAIVPVLLTLDGDEPSEEGKDAGYLTLAYDQVLGIAERIWKQNRSRVPADAAVLIEHYLETIRRLTMKDDDLVELCRTIYRRHREAINIIVEYGASSNYLDACEAAAKSFGPMAFVQRHANRIWFIPQTMAVVQPSGSEIGSWSFLEKPFAVMCWFYHHQKRNKLQFCLEVGPLQDGQLRMRLLHALKDAGFTFWEKGAFRVEAKYTRVLSRFQNLRLRDDGEVDDSEDYVTDVAAGLLKKAWAEGGHVVDVLKAFDWKG